MRLKSFGCSFIFGNDLKDVNDRLGEPYSLPSQYTWPSIFARHFGYGYECYARPGSGNLRILEKVLNHAAQHTGSEMFVIGWSWIDRFDYTTDITERTHQYDITGSNKWCTLMPINTSDTAQTYYKYLHSQYRDKLTSLIYIKTAVDVLRQKNIPFVMTYMDDLLFSTEYYSNPEVLELQDYILPYMTTFEGKTFLDWSRSHGYPESPTWHPLEPAHQAAAELMITVFDKQKTNDPAQQVLV